MYGNFEPPPDSEWETETFKGQVKWYEQKIDTLVGESKTIEQAVAQIAGGKYDSLGESPLLPFLMIARDNKKDISKSNRTKYWCSGKEGGINFDLPTEA